MCDQDSNEIRQNNEFEALQAIYGDQVLDLRKKPAWNCWAPLRLSISLTPQRGSSFNGEIYAKVDLLIVCSNKYPQKQPELELQNGRGISQILLNQLDTELKHLASQHEGAEMIWDLCQHVQEFLHKHNKPPMKSFHDEMLQQQNQKKLQLEAEKQLAEHRLRETMMQEVKKREEILKSEINQRKERQRSLSYTDESSPEGSEEVEACDHSGTVLLDFSGRKVRRGRCLKHINSFCTTFSGLDNNGELLELMQWDLKVTDKQTIQKNLTNIEQELNYLVKLQHGHLVKYLGIIQELHDDRATVYILKEFVLGANCYSIYCGINLKIDYDHLKFISKSVLESLDYLHRHNVVHKNLQSTSVIVSENGIKVADFSIYRRLSDLITSTHGNYNKKTDIQDFGYLILSLLGHSSTDDIPTNLPHDLYDLLLETIEEKERSTAGQLLSHPFFHQRIVQFTPNEQPDDKEDNHNLLRDFDTRSVALFGQSRIVTDFEVLENLGKGAFGDVIKVRKKLDENFYAIKRIKLNPQSKASKKKKILREVNFLARLNHENIVRYYNSWIETTTIKPDKEEDGSVTTTTTDTAESPQKKVKRRNELTKYDVESIENLAPNLEISTYDSKSHYQNGDDSSSSDDDDDDNPFIAESDIEFQRGSDDEDEEEEKEKEASTNQEIKTPQEITVDYLYIQMEFCEKSTLRTAIDNNLYREEDRVWRLFREIVDGLAHIHLQRMIHRDLKPVNIFLDSRDHVKIGDFGLATAAGMRKTRDLVTQKLQIDDDFDESKTGQVGTTLYAAPETLSLKNPTYSEKVDIYSLGVILFEMCYKPFETGMERIKTLQSLRLKAVNLPDDFPNNERANYIIKWLLNHDISKRPSSQELLQSKHLPPPVLEEIELQDLIDHTLLNPQLKGYQYLISSCFKQTWTSAQDITYDRDPSSLRPLDVFEFVKDVCVKIFKQHGGQNLATPLLMPKSKFYDNIESCVNLMTRFGNIVSLPQDLRVPFARYVAWNNINLFRRYSVERVYKEKKVFGFIPREFYECAFDIVTPPKDNLMADAEILYIVYEILNELPELKNKPFLVRLNHTGLFEAIVRHFGLGNELKFELIKLLHDIKEGKVPKYQLGNFLRVAGMSDSNMQLLINLLYAEMDVGKASNQLQLITKKKSGFAAGLAKTALQELKLIVQNAEHYGVQFDFVIAPGLVYNFQQYSGMICQFSCELRKRKKLDNREVVAVGGRYDSTIAYYRELMLQTNTVSKDIKQSAVGISMSLDKLVQVVQKELQKLDFLDAVVCSVGTKQFIKEKTKILRNLWSVGVRCCLIDASNTLEVQEQLTELGVTYAIILKDNEQGMARIWSWDKSHESSEHFQEKIYAIPELIEMFPKIIRDNQDLNVVLSRSESKIEKSEGETNIEVIFMPQDKERLSSTARRRYEHQVRSQLDGALRKLIGNVFVIGTTVDGSIVRTLASHLDLTSEHVYVKSCKTCAERHPKLKHYITDVCERIWKVCDKNQEATVVLYSITDNVYKIL